MLRKFVASDDVESIEEEIADIKEILNDHTNPNCIQELRLLMKWKNLRRYVFPLYCVLQLSINEWTGLAGLLE